MRGLRPCKLFLLGVGVHVDERKGKTRVCKKWLELTLYLRAGREQMAAAGKLSDACGRHFLVAILERAPPMRWEFTWMRQEGFELLGGLLRAGERTDCSGQALEAEGFGLLRGALFYSKPCTFCFYLLLGGYDVNFTA